MKRVDLPVKSEHYHEVGELVDHDVVDAVSERVDRATWDVVNRRASWQLRSPVVANLWTEL